MKRLFKWVLISGTVLLFISLAGGGSDQNKKSVTPAANATSQQTTAPSPQSATEPEAVVETPAPAPAPTPLPTPVALPQAAPTPEPEPASSCDPNYSGGCVPYVSYDLDCADIGFTVQVVGVDHYRLDRDKDGLGCE